METHARDSRRDFLIYMAVMLAALFPRDVERLIHDYANAFDPKAVTAKISFTITLWHNFMNIPDFELWGSPLYVNALPLPKRFKDTSYIDVDERLVMYYVTCYRKYTGCELTKEEEILARKTYYQVGRQVYAVRYPDSRPDNI